MKITWFPSWQCNNYGRDGINPVCRYCHLGYDHQQQVVTMDGVAGPSGVPIAASLVVDFFLRHRELLGSEFDMSGGEPLMRGDLPGILRLLVDGGYSWGITSNSLLSVQIERLRAVGVLEACNSWTCSVHAYGGEQWEVLAANVRALKGLVRHISATVVVSVHTLPILANLWRGVQSLPFDAVQFHLDMNYPAPQVLLDAAREVLPAGARFAMHGYETRGVSCRRWSEFLVVAPDGTVFECFRKAFSGLDPVGNIENLDISRLSGESAWCDLNCHYGCDQRKHENPPAEIKIL